MIKGSLVAIVTPMLAGSQKIDYAAFERLLDFHYKNHTSAIGVAGTTGESPTINVSEHKEVIKFVVDYVRKISKGKMKVIAGTGANSTAEAIELTKSAAQAGADAALLVVPYYNKPTQEGLYLHYKKISDRVNMPQILYNVPSRTSCDLADETVARLAECENIVGIKDATGDLQRLANMQKLIKDKSFAFYSGDDLTAIDFILNGGDGSISVTANILPKELATAYTLALDGKKQEAEEWNDKLIEINKYLFCQSNPIPVKYALYLMGMISDEIRLPLTKLADTKIAKLKEILKFWGQDLT